MVRVEGEPTAVSTMTKLVVTKIEGSQVQAQSFIQKRGCQKRKRKVMWTMRIPNQVEGTQIGYG